jgi:DNA repair protein SbcC/Rad50
MIPKRLGMKNFLSHDISEINFENFNTALILGTYDQEPDQSNGAGKSAIFEAISWALFGRSRHKKKNGVVKWDKTACEVEFEFRLDNEVYLVKRTRDKTVNESDIMFGQWDGSVFQDISCDTNTATDDKIIETIHVNYDVFINSVYFKQNDISMFADNTPGRRKDILKALLRLDKWDKYQNKAKDMAKVLSTQIKDKTQLIVPIDDIKQDIIVCKNELVNFKSQIKIANTEYSQVDSMLMNKKVEYQSSYNSNAEEEFKKIQRDFSNAKKRLEEIRQQKIENDNNIKQSNEQIAPLEQKISIFKDKINQAKKINLDDLQSKMIQGKTKERLLKEKIQLLETDINLTDKCDSCGRPIASDVAKIKEYRKEELIEKKKRYSEIKDQLSRAEDKLKGLEQIVDDGHKAELDKGKTEIRLSKLQNTVEECLSSNERLCAEQLSLEQKDYKKEIADLKNKFNKDAEEQLKNEIISLENKARELKRKIDNLNVEYGSKTSKRDELIKTEEEQAGYQLELTRLNNEFSIYDKLREYFGKDGIQSVIIENIIEELENYSNDILSKICNEPTSISIKTQKQNDNGSWVETFDISVKVGARTDDFETFSGGEQFRISLALRLALSDLLSKRMGGTIKFLLLDEVSSNLDSKGLDMFINIIKKIGNDMKVLIITHDEKLKERFENIILVDKGPSGSRVTVS